MKNIATEDLVLNKMRLLKGTEYWTDLAGQFHREDGPAIVYPCGWEFWYFHGLRDRKDGPAVTMNDAQYWYDRNRLVKVKRYTGLNYIEELYTEGLKKTYKRGKKPRELFELKTNNLEWFIQRVCCPSIHMTRDLFYADYVMGNNATGPSLKNGHMGPVINNCFQSTTIQVPLPDLYLPISHDDFYIKCLKYLPVHKFRTLKVGPKFQERALKMSYDNYRYFKEICVSEDLALRLVRKHPLAINVIKDPSLRVQEEVIRFRPDLIREIPGLDPTLRERYQHELSVSGVDL